MTSHLANYPNQPASTEEMLDALQRDPFGYFLHETNPGNGLVVDKTQPDAVASIAAVGFALAVSRRARLELTVGIAMWLAAGELGHKTRGHVRACAPHPRAESLCAKCLTPGELPCACCCDPAG